MIGLLAKYQYKKKDGSEFTSFVIREHWSGPDVIENWLDGVAAMNDR
ncbi:hypothetical protein HDF15_002041 [Granulicella mallensis]|uniref:Uncharacterized protein n=1 Tax=Granulicella mallensis TaxID=940614 RepID=A0A7W7ZPA7_9BACT|nr:hypothetical protein [Granulicella mallensis]